jgi:GDP-4-dehydro-6-deoxy-D-mannose reductase
MGGDSCAARSRSAAATHPTPDGGSVAQPPALALRVLITGASGLAGGHLWRACAHAGEEVVGISRHRQEPPAPGETRALDLRDGPALRALLGELAPDVVYHLAARSSVSASWEDPAATVRENIDSALALLEALRAVAPATPVIWASSCELYGPAERLPIVEDSPPAPANPYAVSKTAAEMLARVYAQAHGLPIVRVRPFNHAGPGQRPIFLLSSLAMQAARARLAGAHRLELVTGNPQTRRDFTDVRDVVRAYRLLAAHALGLVRSGADGPARFDPEREVYNVCSGRAVSAAEQVALLAQLLDPIEVVHVVDPARVRAHEVMELRGCYRRLRELTGWEPQIDLRQTMADTVAWWESALAERTREP